MFSVHVNAHRESRRRPSTILTPLNRVSRLFRNRHIKIGGSIGVWKRQVEFAKAIWTIRQQRADSILKRADQRVQRGRIRRKNVKVEWPERSGIVVLCFIWDSRMVNLRVNLSMEIGADPQ